MGGEGGRAESIVELAFVTRLLAFGSASWTASLRLAVQEGAVSDLSSVKGASVQMRATARENEREKARPLAGMKRLPFSFLC